MESSSQTIAFAASSTFTPCSTLYTSSSSFTTSSSSPVRRRTKLLTTVNKNNTPRAVLGSRAPWDVQTDKKYKVTVQQKKTNDIVIEVDSDTDLRAAFLSNGIDLYTLGGKFRNCGGGGQCGTCLISIEDGRYSSGVRTAREEFLLSDKPDSWRLACRTKISGDVTIKTKPQT